MNRRKFLVLEMGILGGALCLSIPKTADQIYLQSLADQMYLQSCGWKLEGSLWRDPRWPNLPEAEQMWAALLIQEGRDR